MPQKKDLVVIISGASGQLGQVFCKALSERNASVIAVDKKPNTQINYSDFNSKVDVTNEEEVRAFFDELGRPADILINNAGEGVYTPTQERTAAEFMQVLKTNLLSVMLMTNNFLFFHPPETGHVINIGSIYGHRASDYRIYGKSKRNNSEAYTASKAGLIAMTKYYAANFAHLGFRFNSVSPGGVFNNQSSDFIERYSKKSPQNRMARAHEIAEVVTYLALDSPEHVNGADIIVDGGLTTW